MGNPTSKRISPGDTSYSDVWSAWDENGRPHRFDRMGSWGGAIYDCRDLDLEEPNFYQIASMGPTLWAENTSSTPSQKGWYHSFNRDYCRLKAKWTNDGRIRITRPKIPNDL